MEPVTKEYIKFCIEQGKKGECPACKSNENNLLETTIIQVSDKALVGVKCQCRKCQHLWKGIAMLTPDEKEQ